MNSKFCESDIRTEKTSLPLIPKGYLRNKTEWELTNLISSSKQPSKWKQIQMGIAVRFPIFQIYSALTAFQQQILLLQS